MVSFQRPGRLSRELWWGTLDSVGKQTTCWKHCTRIVFTHHEVKYTQWDSSILPLLASLYHKSNKINSPWFAKVQCFSWQHNFFWPVCKLTETVSLSWTEFHLYSQTLVPGSSMLVSTEIKVSWKNATVQSAGLGNGLCGQREMEVTFCNLSLIMPIP